MDWKESIADDLQAPFKWPWATCRLVCVKCGHISEIDSEVAQNLIKIMGMLGAFPEIILAGEKDFKNYYFEIGYCKRCRRRSQEQELSIKLKTLKQELK